MSVVKNEERKPMAYAEHAIQLGPVNPHGVKVVMMQVDGPVAPQKRN